MGGFVNYDCVGLVWRLASTDVIGVALVMSIVYLAGWPDFLILGRKWLGLILVWFGFGLVWFEFPFTLFATTTYDDIPLASLRFNVLIDPIAFPIYIYV